MYNAKKKFKKNISMHEKQKQKIIKIINQMNA